MKVWTRDQASAWLLKNGFTINSVDKMAKYYSFRQKSPELFSRFRASKSFGDGILVIYGIKDGKSTVQSVRFYHGGGTVKKRRA